MDWKSLVGSIAPILGGSLGGPLGAMAGKWLSNELGVDESDLEATVSNADPDTLLKIRELDSKFKTDMAKLGLDEKKLHAQDRDSARQMAAKTTLLPQMAISVVFIAGFMFIAYQVFGGSVELTGSSETMATYLLGILSGGIVQVMNFFFGSSSGSKEKTSKLK